MSRRPRLLGGMVAVLALILAACASVPAAPTAPSVEAMLATIHAAGRRDQSVLRITPLRPRSLQLLLQSARSLTLTGDNQGAQATLARAQQAAPDDPEVLQLQAENAIRLHQYAQAEQLAQRSWSVGAKLGAMCARNWQTVYEMRRLAQDAAGMTQAKRALSQCQKQAIKRM